MDVTAQITALEANAPAIAALARAMPPERAYWRPTPEDWSAVEVVNHLADEETEDFRDLLDRILHRPEEPLPADSGPTSDWVVARAYNERDFDESLSRFLREREASLAWLRSLGAPDWSRTAMNPSGRTRRAGDVLVAWAAHDLLHLRQLVEIQFAHRAADAAPYSVDYAGEW